MKYDLTPLIVKKQSVIDVDTTFTFADEDAMNLAQSKLLMALLLTAATAMIASAAAEPDIEQLHAMH